MHPVCEVLPNDVTAYLRYNNKRARHCLSKFVTAEHKHVPKIPTHSALVAIVVLVGT